MQRAQECHLSGLESQRGEGHQENTAACERVCGTNRAGDIFLLDKQRMEAERGCVTAIE